MKINNIPDEQLESQLKYLKLLSKQYPSISSASAEIINLEAPIDWHLVWYDIKKSTLPFPQP